MKFFVIDPNNKPSHGEENDPPIWAIVLFYLIVLIMMGSQRPQPPPETLSISVLKRTIWTVMIILIVLILATLGGAEYIDDVFSGLSIVP